MVRNIFLGIPWRLIQLVVIPIVFLVYFLYSSIAIFVAGIAPLFQWLLTGRSYDEIHRGDPRCWSLKISKTTMFYRAFMDDNF